MSEENDVSSKKSSNRIGGIIIILLIIIIIILLMRSCSGGPCPLNDTTKPTQGLVIDNADDWDGNLNTSYVDDSGQECIEIPGFSKIAVNKNHKEISLYNFKENTVYFVYTITDIKTGETVLQTNAIAPGKAVKWNVYDTLGVGEFTVLMSISTYDVVTQEECYGSETKVSVLVQ